MVRYRIIVADLATFTTRVVEESLTLNEAKERVASMATSCPSYILNTITGTTWFLMNNTTKEPEFFIRIEEE